jgi:hypothetical protein
MKDCMLFALNCYLQGSLFLLNQLTSNASTVFLRILQSMCNWAFLRFEWINLFFPAVSILWGSRNCFLFLSACRQYHQKYFKRMLLFFMWKGIFRSFYQLNSLSAW